MKWSAVVPPLPKDKHRAAAAEEAEDSGRADTRQPQVNGGHART